MQSNQDAINALESELGNMTEQIDVLAGAFGQVVDFDDSTANWGSPNLMKRIRNFLRAVRSFMFWWNQQEQISSGSSHKILEGEAEDRTSDTISVDENFRTRQNSPQLYTDPASVNRSLREDS